MEAQLQSLLGHGVMWRVGGCEAFLSRTNRFTPAIQILDKNAYSSLRPCRDSKLNYPVNQHVVYTLY